MSTISQLFLTALAPLGKQCREDKRERKAMAALHADARISCVNRGVPVPAIHMPAPTRANPALAAVRELCGRRVSVRIRLSRVA